CHFNFFERLHCKLDALFSDSKLGNHFAIAFDVVHPEVIEQSPALANDLQQPATRPMIFLMSLEVLGKVRNPFAKKCDLNFRGSCVRGMDSVRVDDGSLDFFRETHLAQIQSLFSKLRRSIPLSSEVIEVSTSRGCAKPFSTEATARNSPFLLKMRANRPLASTPA